MFKITRVKHGRLKHVEGRRPWEKSGEPSAVLVNPLPYMRGFPISFCPGPGAKETPSTLAERAEEEPAGTCGCIYERALTS